MRTGQIVPVFGNVPLLLVQVPVSFVHGIGLGVCQRFFGDDRLAVKEQPIHDVGEYVVIGFQILFRDILF